MVSQWRHHQTSSWVAHDGPATVSLGPALLGTAYSAHASDPAEAASKYRTRAPPDERAHPGILRSVLGEVGLGRTEQSTPPVSTDLSGEVVGLRCRPSVLEGDVPVLNNVATYLGTGVEIIVTSGSAQALAGQLFDDLDSFSMALGEGKVGFLAERVVVPFNGPLHLRAERAEVDAIIASAAEAVGVSGVCQDYVAAEIPGRGDIEVVCFDAYVGSRTPLVWEAWARSLWAATTRWGGVSVAYVHGVAAPIDPGDSRWLEVLVTYQPMQIQLGDGEAVWSSIVNGRGFCLEVPHENSGVVREWEDRFKALVEALSPEPSLLVCSKQLMMHGDREFFVDHVGRFTGRTHEVLWVEGDASERELAP
jgi:hypothetical protein